MEIGRSKNIFGPYEAHPSGEPILTSSPVHLFSKGNPDAGKFDMYNPDSKIQKSGHGSLIQTANGEWYMAHLMSRPLLNKKLNPLGRETDVQKMHWAIMTLPTLQDNSKDGSMKPHFNSEKRGNELDS